MQAETWYFLRPGKTSGPMDVRAWSSVDGVTKSRSVSEHFRFLLVDPHDERDEYSEDNNTAAARVTTSR